MTRTFPQSRPAATRRRLPGAAARVGTFTAPAGWRAQVPRELVAVSRPSVVEQVVAEVVALPEQPGLSARAVSDVTRALAGRTDRSNGLVIGASLDALAAAAQWSRATVRRVIAHLVDLGRLCRVGVPLSARVLGTDRGLTPVYVFARPRRTLKSRLRMSTPPHLTVGEERVTQDASARETSEGYSSDPFGKRDRPRTRRDRKDATTRLLAELGLTGRVPTAAAAAALAPWWRAGWCVAALVWAVHHRPGDLPGTTRGAASNGTIPANPSGRPRQEVRDPLRLVLWRLRWWADTEPPAAFAAVDRRQRLASLARSADPGRTAPAASDTVRADRMAAIRAALTRRTPST